MTLLYTHLEIHYTQNSKKESTGTGMKLVKIMCCFTVSFFSRDIFWGGIGLNDFFGVWLYVDPQNLHSENQGTGRPPAKQNPYEAMDQTCEIRESG